MQYFGGKVRISNNLSRFLNSQLKENQPFVDLFCGSCNVISKIDSDRLRIANDKHKYLISMWKDFQKGVEPPIEITYEQYQYVKSHLDENPGLSGFVGFCCSFSGKWFGGYARSGDRNYCLNAYNSTKKKLKTLDNVQFCSQDYRDVIIPKGSLVYCDIPYRNTTQYCKAEVGEFNHNEFYEWVDENYLKYDIFISEYEGNQPSNYDVVWSMESKQGIRDKLGKQRQTQEIIIKHVDQEFEIAV